MPDLSILVQLAEYYDVEIRELLDGERSQTMNKEMKETLDKVAVYEEWVKQKALKAGNLAFASMFVISVLAIIIQMLLTVDIRLVLGETATALVGGILYASIMVYNGIWDKCLPKSATIWRDFFTSVICAGIFTVIYGICLFRMGATETQVTRLAVGFLIGITIVAFIVLRLLAFINRKRNQNSSNVQEKKETSISKAEWTKIYNAQNIVETEQLVEMLKQNGIAAFSQEAGANVAMHGAPGFGIYGVDIFVKTDDAEKAVQLIKEINNQERTVFAQLFRHSRHHLWRRQHANLHGIRTDIFIDCVHLRADNLRRNILLFQHMHGVFRHDGYDHAHRVHAVCGYRLDIRLNTRAAGAIRPGDGQYALHCTHHSESSETVRFCTSTGSSAWIVNVGFVSSSTCAMTVFATPFK